MQASHHVAAGWPPSRLGPASRATKLDISFAGESIAPRTFTMHQVGVEPATAELTL